MQQHFRQRCRLAVTAATAALCLSTYVEAQVGSITTNLLGRIDSKRVAVGSPFFVKAISDWRQGPCRVQLGDTLEGRVVAATHEPKHEQIQLRFMPLTCAGAESYEIIPLLVALQTTPEHSDDSMLDRAALVAFMGSAIGSHNPAGQGMAPPRESTTNPSGEYIPGTDNRHPLHMAEVQGFPGVKLTLPNLTSDPTGLYASRELLFDPGTRFVLVIRLLGTHPSPSSIASTQPSAHPPSSSAKASAQPPKEVADVETCVEGGCAAADSPALNSDGQLERRLSLRGLGYRARNNRILRSLPEDAAVRFLGESQLLVTFNTHALIQRSHEDIDQRNDPRVIRSLLVSTKTGKVTRSVEWRVLDDGPYLWPLANGRVLAHVEDRLVVYGPGLVVEKQWKLPGSLASLHVSPTRNLLVAVIVDEQHTPDQHRRLAEFIGPGRLVDEDYDLTVLDGNLNVVGTKNMRSMPDVSEVLDSGLLVSEAETRQRWQIREIAWDGKPRNIVRVHSSCPVGMRTLPNNLILLVGCSADASHSWYKVVRTDGKTLLNGVTASNDCLEQADALEEKGLFAISIIEASRPVDFGDGMLASEFQKIAVSVYSSRNGRRLYATQTANSAVNRQSFALSDSGDQLAILSGEDVSLYRIAGSTGVASNAPASH